MYIIRVLLGFLIAGYWILCELNKRCHLGIIV